MKTTDEGFFKLMRRAKKLQARAEEYLALLAAMQDIRELAGGGEPDDSPIPLDSTDSQDLDCMVSDARARAHRVGPVKFPSTADAPVGARSKT